MACQIENELDCGVYELSSMVKRVRVDGWTAEWAIIASNEFSKFSSSLSTA